MNKLENWQQTSQIAKQKKRPVVLMVDRSDCPYCRRVEGEFFSAIFASGQFDERAIFAKISIDSGETVISGTGEVIATQAFLAPYKASLTPTVLFIDGDKAELAEKIIGLTTPDYYGFYLERSINQAIARVNSPA